MQHNRCECHDCTQARAKERDPFYPLPNIPIPQELQRSPVCAMPCCRPGYVGDCFCTHGRGIKELEFQLTQARDEIERLNNQTNYCLQCESYAKDRDRLKAENERMRGLLKDIDMAVVPMAGAEKLYQRIQDAIKAAMREGEGR